MKRLLLSAALLAGATSANAQLAAGSIAPNFTVTAYQSWLSTAGMNGNGTYNLYDYLDAGYTVIMDVSATWCGPCWSYHTGGALEDLYAAHGPAGYPGVNAGTTDDVMVIWVEGDGATADATQIAFSGLPFAPAGAPYGAETIAYQASFNTNAGDSYLVDTPNSIVRVYTNAGAARAGNAANVNINNRIAFSGWYTT